MVKKMKLPFLNKNTLSSSNSSSSSSSWPWPSCQENPEAVSSFILGKPNHVEEPEPPRGSFSSSSCSFSTSRTMENIPEIESIENVLKGLKSSRRLIFEHRGKSNSILEEANKRKTNEEEDCKREAPEVVEEGFRLLSLESNDPYSDFKKSMEKMVEAHALHHDWRSLEKLLFWFLKVNVKTSHHCILAAFVDLLVGIVAGEPYSEESPSSPISFYTSYSSSSNETLSGNSIGEKSRDVVCCLSSLFEMEKKTKHNLDSGL